jgi:zinc D-Ala-D-Ala carboxypeptidase
MQLSKHFKLEEFEKSMTATRKGISNKAGSGEIANLRAKFGKPITVTSGYRSEALCEAIGSKKTSQHTKGQAVDFEIIGIHNLKVAEWIKSNCDFDQLILEYFNREEKNAGWIHVSYNEKGKNRKAVLTFDGKTYENGLPEMKYSFDKSGNEVIS